MYLLYIVSLEHNKRLMIVLYQINLNGLTIIYSLFNCFSELMTR